MSGRRLLIVAAIAVALVVHTVLLHQIYTWRGNTHPDFYIEWVGSRVALDGGNPYSNETTLAIQMGSKGQLIPPEGDQLAFVYPYYRVFLNAPIAFLPYAWATAIWQTAMQATLMAGALLFIRGLGWQASAKELGLVVMVTLLSYPTFGGLMLGQMAVGVLALLLIAFWALRCGHEYAAGSCLALATVKPQLAILAVPFLLLWSLFRRRLRVVLAFALVLGLLAGLSWLMFPLWLQEFVRATMHYPSYKNVQAGPGYLLSGRYGEAWPWLLGALAGAWLLASWWLAWRGRTRWQDGGFALTLGMTSFLLPQTSIVNHLVLLPGILLLMQDVSNWVARIALVLLSTVGSWTAFAVLYRTQYDLNMSLPPLIVLLALAAWYAKEVRTHERETAPESQPL